MPKPWLRGISICSHALMKEIRTAAREIVVKNGRRGSKFFDEFWERSSKVPKEMWKTRGCGITGVDKMNYSNGNKRIWQCIWSYSHQFLVFLVIKLLLDLTLCEE